MKCPSCSSLLPEHPDACPECGFHLEELSTRFGALPRHSIFVTDTTMQRMVTPRQHKTLERKLAYFSKKFPQSRFSIVLTQLRPNAPIREYTFYLMNRCQFSPFANKGSRNFSLLLLVDVTSGDACLMTGYGLEPWLTEENLEHILAKAGSAFKDLDFYSGGKICVAETMSVLRDKLTAKRKGGAAK